MTRNPSHDQRALLRGLATIQCTDDEMAAVTGLSVATLRRRYRTLLATARSEGRATLRRCQWQSALGGSAAMLAWLGKQELGQRERALFENRELPTLKILDQPSGQGPEPREGRLPDDR